MSLRRTMKESEFVTLDEGLYPIVCMDVRADTLENPQFGDGDVIRFTLRFEDIVDPEGEDVTRDAIANDKLTPLSKLTGWLKAFGVEVGVGEDVDLEECIGKKALARVGHREKDGKVYDRIEDILPAIKSRQEDKEISELEVSDWWALTRKEGFTRSHVMEVCAENYDGKEPKDLTGKQREELFAVL